MPWVVGSTGPCQTPCRGAHPPLVPLYHWSCLPASFLLLARYWSWVRKRSISGLGVKNHCKTPFEMTTFGRKSPFCQGASQADPVARGCPRCLLRGHWLTCKGLIYPPRTVSRPSRFSSPTDLCSAKWSKNGRKMHKEAKSEIRACIGGNF